MENLQEALSKSMIKNAKKHGLNNTYYIVIPWATNLRKCIINSNAIFVDNEIYDSGYSPFFIATKEQAQELKNITGEKHNLIFSICAKKQYSTIEEIIKDYFDDYLRTDEKNPNLIDVTDQF